MFYNLEIYGLWGIYFSLTLIYLQHKLFINCSDGMCMNTLVNGMGCSKHFHTGYLTYNLLVIYTLKTAQSNHVKCMYIMRFSSVSTSENVLYDSNWIQHNDKITRMIPCKLATYNYINYITMQYVKLFLK